MNHVTNQLTDELIIRRLGERAGHPDAQLLSDILDATETLPQRRTSLAPVWRTAWTLLVLALLLAAVAAVAILSSRPPGPSDLRVEVKMLGSGGLGLSPDGRWNVPFTTDGHAVVSTDPNAPRDANGLPVAVASWKGESGGVAWSPDGRHVAWYGGGDGTVPIYDLEHPGAAPESVSVGKAVPISNFGGMLWSPDGTTLAFATYDCPGDCTAINYQCPMDCSTPPLTMQVYLLTVSDNSIRTVSESLPPGALIRFSPDGKYLGFRGGLIIDLGGQTIRDLLPGFTDGVMTENLACYPGPHWSPDGSKVVAIDPLTAETCQLLIFDPGVSEPRTLVADASRVVGWSPNGDRIVYLTGDPTAVTEVDDEGIPTDGPGTDLWIVSTAGGAPDLIQHLDYREIPILSWSGADNAPD